MLPSEIEFGSTVAAIRSYLDFQVALDGALAQGGRTGTTGGTSAEARLAELANCASRTTPKRFVHDLVVIELYGAIEQLVEGLVRDYLGRIQIVHPVILDVPERLLQTHDRKSAELLLAMERLPFKVVPRDIIANLHSCQQTSGPYRFNADAFTLRFANMRTSQIRKLFGDVGIENITRSAYDSPHFQVYLRQRGTRRTRQVGETEFPSLDELVTYRNEAAHGRSSDILSRDILLEYVEFAHAVGNALARTVEEASIRMATANGRDALGKLVRVFRSRVVCLELTAPIKVGEQIVGRTPEGRCRFGSVRRIEIDHQSVDHAEAGDVVGLEVDFHAKGNQVFFRLPW